MGCNNCNCNSCSEECITNVIKESGLRGPQGAKGDEGTQGEPGPTGLTGPTGPSGSLILDPWVTGIDIAGQITETIFGGTAQSASTGSIYYLLLGNTVIVNINIAINLSAGVTSYSGKLNASLLPNSKAGLQFNAALLFTQQNAGTLDPICGNSLMLNNDMHILFSLKNALTAANNQMNVRGQLIYEIE